jgi:membrane protein
MPQVADVSNRGTASPPSTSQGTGSATIPATEPEEEPSLAVQSLACPPNEQAEKRYRWRRDGKALLAYLLDSEVHTFAFSVAANAIISFIPFVVLLYALARSLFHSQRSSDPMVKIISQMVVYFIPSTASREWLTDNLWHASGHGVEIFSLIMIFVACTGIFLPLEVALNQAWGVKKSRNYLYNQTVAVGLVLLMVVLGMASILLNEAIQAGLEVLFFNPTPQDIRYILFRGISYVFLASTTGAACIVFFFFIYWLLPNRKTPWRPVMRTAVVTGIIWMIARVIIAAVLPHIDLKIYGPFYVSVGLLFWAYISGLILFAGAQFSVTRVCNNGIETVITNSQAVTASEAFPAD